MEPLKGIKLDTSQQEALEELRRRVSGGFTQEQYDEAHTYYRFLKVKDFDVDQAEIMLRDTLRWRKENKIDTIHTDFKPSEIFKDYLHNLNFTYHKDGGPVYYVASGKFDIKGIFMSVKRPDILKSLVQLADMSERIIENQSKKLNKRVPGVVLIIDVEEFTFAQATDKAFIELIIWFAKTYQKNYPERLKALFIINSSSYFILAFSIIKSFLEKLLMDKIFIFSQDGWKEELVKVIDADELPVFLGGNKTDPDGNPLCKTILCQGGKVDEKHYFNKNKKSLAKSPGVQKLVLSRASFSEVPVEVGEADSLIEFRRF